MGGWDDDKWPEPERDPAKLEERRGEIRKGIRAGNQALRIVYASLAVLVVLVIVMAYLATR